MLIETPEYADPCWVRDTGRGEQPGHPKAMSDETQRIQCQKNGPYLVKGPLDIVDPTGQVVTVGADKTVALCRCGGSASKPFCDGTHSKLGFQAAEAAVRQSG